MAVMCVSLGRKHFSSLRSAQWLFAIGCMQGLRVLHSHLGRNAEWSRLVDGLIPNLFDPTTGGPISGREDEWRMASDYRVEIAEVARDWAEAERLLETSLAWAQAQAAAALAAPPDKLTPVERNEIRSLAVTTESVGHILRKQGRSECVERYRQAADLFRRIGASREESVVAFNIGSSYLTISELRDLDEAERWFRRTLAQTEAHDRLGRAQTTSRLGEVALRRFLYAQNARLDEKILTGYLTTACEAYEAALALTPSEVIGDLAVDHHQLGIVYQYLGRLDLALEHQHKAIRYREEIGDRYAAGRTRMAVSATLALSGRLADAVLYLRAALRDFAPYGAGAADETQRVEDLIATYEQRMSERPE